MNSSIYEIAVFPLLMIRFVTHNQYLTYLYNIFPLWECCVPRLGTSYSHYGNISYP